MYFPVIWVNMPGNIGQMTCSDKYQGRSVHGLAEDVVFQESVAYQVLTQIEREQMIQLSYQRREESPLLALSNGAGSRFEGSKALIDETSFFVAVLTNG